VTSYFLGAREVEGFGAIDLLFGMALMIPLERLRVGMRVELSRRGE
jgi:hypothetical protein